MAGDTERTIAHQATGTFTPAITFETPGDLSVTCSLQSGRYTKNGRLVTIDIALRCETFTHSTASGAITITGMPFQPTTTQPDESVLLFNGGHWTLAGASNVAAYAEDDDTITVYGDVSGSGSTQMGAAHFTSGQAQNINISGTYTTAEDS